MIITFVYHMTWVKQRLHTLGIFVVNKLLRLEVRLLTWVILHSDIENAPTWVILRLFGHLKCKFAPLSLLSRRDDIEAVAALQRCVVDCRPQAWWVDSALKHLELIPHVRELRDPGPSIVMDILVLDSALVEITRAHDADRLTLPYLLESDVPALGHLVVTELEHFWLVVKPQFGVLYLSFPCFFILQITLIIDGDEVVLLAPPLLLRLLCLRNSYTIVRAGNRLGIVAHVIVVTVEADAWHLGGVFFVRQNGLLSSKFLEFLLLILSRDILRGRMRISHNIDRLNVVGTRNIGEKGSFKDFHFKLVGNNLSRFNLL